MRQEENKRARDRESTKRANDRASRPEPMPIIRECQHKQEQDGPICGIKFEAKPRIDKKSVDRGVSAKQAYCPKHQEPTAVARRRWLNRNVENYKKLQRDYRHRNLTTVREKQRSAAKAKRATVAAILSRPSRPTDWWQRSIDDRIIGNVLLSQEAYMPNEELGRRLDDSRLLMCPTHYGDYWETALTRNKTAINYVSGVRRWVGRSAPNVRTRRKA